MTRTDPKVRPRSATDTTPVWTGLATAKRGRLVRRVLLSVFAVILLLGATGFFGVRTGRASAIGGGYDVRVEYPRVTRPGHAVPLVVEVRRAGGFGDEPVVVAMRASYFSLFDANGMFPNPSAETADGRRVIWEFDPPPGEVLRVVFDTRTGPNKQRGEHGFVSVLVDDAAVATATFRTRVMP